MIREDEKEEVSSYQLTLRKFKDIVIWATKHFVWNWLCKRLWAFGKADQVMNKCILQQYFRTYSKHSVWVSRIPLRMSEWHPDSIPGHPMRSVVDRVALGWSFVWEFDFLHWGSFHQHLTLRTRNYLLVLAHHVYKMWIIHEPNTIELWNKLHFEEEKKRRIYPMFKIFSTYICWINI